MEFLNKRFCGCQNFAQSQGEKRNTLIMGSLEVITTSQTFPEHSWRLRCAKEKASTHAASFSHCPVMAALGDTIWD